MYWIADIQDLSYYNTPQGVECYCYEIIDASDLTLHGILDYNGNLSNYTAVITMMSPDGLSTYGTITSSFSVNYGKNPSGQHFFIANLNKIPSLMCTNPCFILRVEIKTGNVSYFAYYTDRYCAPADCCDVPSGILIVQEGTISPSPNWTQGNNPNTGTVTGSRPNASNNCAKPTLKLETFSDCYDNITKRYYKPINGKRYINVFNIQGVLRKLPYEIQRTNSLNCRLQQSQVQKQYLLVGSELFSEEAMDEITASLSCQYIFIEGRRYEMNNDVPFEEVRLPNVCKNYYRLRATFVDCLTKQIYGCGDNCENNQQAFLQPLIYNNGDGYYYNENYQNIGSTVDDLVNYFKSQPLVTSVTLLDPGDYDCDFTVGILVEGDGYIPTSFYYGGVSPNQRIFGQDPATLDVCSTVTSQCAPPQIGAITNTENICPQPVIGAIVNTPIPTEDLYFTGYGNWGLVSNISTKTSTTVQLKFEVKNTTITYDSGDPEAEIPNVAMQIGYVSEAGWPLFPINITKNEAPSMEEDAVVTIQSDGKVFYSGTVTAADLTGSTISITDITYQV